MSVDPNELLSLPAAEKLRLIELLWNDLGQTTDPLPIPQWVVDEATKRRDEMLEDPDFGLTHDETWSQIHKPHG